MSQVTVNVNGVEIKLDTDNPGDSRTLAFLNNRKEQAQEEVFSADRNMLKGLMIKALDSVIEENDIEDSVDSSLVLVLPLKATEIDQVELVVAERVTIKSFVRKASVNSTTA